MIFPIDCLRNQKKTPTTKTTAFVSWVKKWKYQNSEPKMAVWGGRTSSVWNFTYLGIMWKGQIAGFVLALLWSSYWLFKSPHVLLREFTRFSNWCKKPAVCSPRIPLKLQDSHMSDLVWEKPSIPHCRTCDRAAVRTGGMLLQIGLAECCWAWFWPWCSLELAWMIFMELQALHVTFKGEHRILPPDCLGFFAWGSESSHVRDADTGSKMSTDLPVLSFEYAFGGG